MVDKRWVKKYRPTSLTEYAMDPSLRPKFEKYIREKNMPHLILYSEAGMGKTSLAKLIIKEFGAEELRINGSDETGVDMIRQEVSRFAKMASLDDSPKIVFIDEADRLSPAAQDSLKVIVEENSDHTTFIFVTNHIEKVDLRLDSRAEILPILPAPIKEVGELCLRILDAEQVQYDKRVIMGYINRYYPDLRKLVDSLQNGVHEGKLTDSGFPGNDVLDDILNTLLDDSQTQDQRWLSIQTLTRKHSATHDTGVFYRHLYRNIGSFPPVKRLQAIGAIGTALRVQNIVPDREINWMACVADLLLILTQ